MELESLPTFQVNRLKQYDEIQLSLLELYNEKNVRYKDSFATQFSRRGRQKGLEQAEIRLTDKLERFSALVENPNLDSRDESIEDTLRDLANYAIMTLMSLQDTD